MNNPSQSDNYEEDDEDDDLPVDDSDIRWSNLLFLPFHPVFKFLVMLAVIVKSVLGPLQAVYPIVYCWDVLDQNIYLWIIKYFYLYGCDFIYGIDTCLHIMHRRMTDEAMRREFLPKSALLLFFDIVCLIPFYRLIEKDPCFDENVEFWPNILSFIEFLTIYRVAQYFSLLTTHKYWKLCVGFTLIYFIVINCITCFLILLTFVGLCKDCTGSIYKDWRQFVSHKFNESGVVYSTYIYGASFIFCFPLNIMFDDIKASTLSEHVFFSLLMVFFYLMKTFIILPKMVAEVLLRVRQIYSFYPRIRIIVAETKRRNPSYKAYVDVKDFYSLMWKEHCGITRIPKIFSSLPRYLRLDIKQDLVWSVFHHSPTLRKCSNPFQRWLCDYIHLDYKLPGSKFFVGPQCQTHLYYLKSGIVQLISADDGTTPIISLTNGTIFGDVSFFFPPLKRRVIVRCLTYCELFYVTRADILKALHRFPEDRKAILTRVKEKIKHAHTLYTCKQHVRGLDRTEDEGIAWIKRRWREISSSLYHWKTKQGQKTEYAFQLPPEETVYHCSKYIGQLVLCSDAQLKRNSLFARVHFPLILVPNSNFCVVWHRIVTITVVLVLILYPPNITRVTVPLWFNFFQLWTDFLFIADLCVCLLTSLENQNITEVDFATVMFARFKSAQFYFDVLATLWFESLVTLIGIPEYYYIVQFNRLIKVYVLFTHWNIGKNPLLHVVSKICLINLIFVYISSYLIFALVQLEPKLTSEFFFGETFCKVDQPKNECNYKLNNIFQVFISWLLELLFINYLPQTLADVYTIIVIIYIAFLILLYSKSTLIGIFHANNTGVSNYQYFVTNITKHYKKFQIHPDLLKRLDRYLTCHWKHYKGSDVLYPNLFQNEPFDIYWKVHGEVAEKVIKESRPFLSADPALIKELAYNAKFLMLPEKGFVKCEYLNDKGELLKRFYKPGDTLAFSAAFFANQSLKTFIAYTDCEVLVVKTSDFFNILRRFPNEIAHFEMYLDELKPRFDQIIQEHMKKHRDYQKKVRQRIFHSRMSVVDRRHISRVARNFRYSTTFNTTPSSDFMQIWMPFRAIIVCVSIISAALQGGGGVYWRWSLIMIGAVCDCVAMIDIIFKLFMPYYDIRGLVITDTRACIKRYLSRGFLMDIIGTFPVYEIYIYIMTKDIDKDDILLINTISKFAHLYLLIGYFNYLADKPTANIALIMMLKWQIVSVLVMFAASHFFIRKCINFNLDEMGTFVNATLISECWLPSVTNFDNELTRENINLIFAQSLNLAQCGIMRMDLGMFKVDHVDIGTAIILFLLGSSFWFILCYCLTLLVLKARSNTLFQHGVSQLKRFLEAERVENSLINSAQEHFKYVWQRTQGINMQKLMSERIGVVFKQDLSYFFYKQTFSALDTLLQGGEKLERELASDATQMYFLPGQEIVREMDLAPWVYVIHRGKVAISRNGEKLAVLTKGSIFGQLDGVKPRPVRFSAEAVGYADVLQITIEDFQEALNDEIRHNIEQNIQSKLDFMALKKPVTENPYNTLQYILQGKKAIQLPWMKTHMEAHNGSRYSKWLFLTWLIEPVATAFAVLTLETVPHKPTYNIYWFLLVLDIVRFLYIVSDFFRMELTVVEGKCVLKTLNYRILLNWGFYADLLSIVVPLATFLRGNRLYQLVKLVRLRLLYDFYRYFCTGFQSRVGPVLIKFLIVILMLHAMTCGWIMVACRDQEFTLKVPDIPSFINVTIDYNEWTLPNKRIGGGCARMTDKFIVNKKLLYSFIVPKTWSADYIVSMTYILVLYTQTEMDVILSLSLKQVYYKIVMNFVIFILDMWILSIAIGAVYTKLNDLYKYDYNVMKLITYLRHTGLSPTLLQTVENYTKHLWKRQRGNWLPELAQNAPQCLREDILGALYIYHLKTPPLLRDLPHHFIRQLVARLNRLVIFPGKLIVQEGDIFSCIYFIHEGEVEKWATDKSGEKKIVSLLNTNDYFGFIPGLFPNSQFQFTYISRTVVDLVFLRFKDWQDLLQGYPKVKYNLYTAAKQLKKEMTGKD